MIDIIVIGVIVIFVLLSIYKIHKDKKAGKNRCGSSCGSCAMSNTCELKWVEEYRKDHQ